MWKPQHLTLPSQPWRLRGTHEYFRQGAECDDGPRAREVRDMKLMKEDMVGMTAAVEAGAGDREVDTEDKPR